MYLFHSLAQNNIPQEALSNALKLIGRVPEARKNAAYRDTDKGECSKTGSLHKSRDENMNSQSNSEGLFT